MAQVPTVPKAAVAQASTPVPPPVIPAWILGGGNFYGGQQVGASPCPTQCNFYDVDPGPTPDQRLFAGVINAADSPDTALETNCPGIGSGGGNVANCNPYKYINMSVLVCDTSLSISAFNYLNTSDEAGFLHVYASPTASPTPAPGNRIQLSGGQCATPTPSPNSSAFPTNPDDSGFQSWLLTNAWTTGQFPIPFGISEDNYAVVGYECDLSYEYGNQACNVRGNSESPAPHDWETALGDFEKNAQTNCPTTCFAFIGNGLTPGGGSNTGSCSSISGGHCYVPGFGGVVDDMDALDNLCTAADTGGNLRALEAEEIVFLKGTPGSPFYANAQTIIYMINTMSHLVNYTSGGCANTVAIDVEASGGSFYPLNGYTAGTVSGGYQTRLAAAALRFLVPNPATLVPDRMRPLYFTVGGTNNHWSPTSDQCSTTTYCEIPYFFEETLVPQGPEVSVGSFSWNGTAQSPGDGCPTNPGDTGGAVDLVATCVGTVGGGDAVFRQQYHHLYIDGSDYGPAAILLNTSGATLTISSSWFLCTGCDHITAFHYRLALSGGELASVMYPGQILPMPLKCTQTTFCNGDNTVAGNTTAFTPTTPGTIGPHSGAILLASH